MRWPFRCAAKTCCTSGSPGWTSRRARSPPARRKRSGSSARSGRSPRPSSRTASSPAGCCWSVYGAKQDEVAIHERVGGALTAKLLTSGETKLVIDLRRPRRPRGGAARLRRSGAQLASRRLPHQARPQAEADAGGSGHRRRGRGRREGMGARGGGAGRARLHPRPGQRAAQRRLSRDLRRALPRGGSRASASSSRSSTRRRWRKLGMGALLGVAQGSVRPPRLLVMRWNGAGKAKKTVAFVGKGVTFDTGGISIKPAAGMEEMKWDMGGAGAVAGAMKALAAAQGQGQRRRRLRARREHARRQRPAAGRRRHLDVGPDDRGDQHRRRRAARPRRRDDLGAARSTSRR